MSPLRFCAVCFGKDPGGGWGLGPCRGPMLVVHLALCLAGSHARVLRTGVVRRQRPMVCVRRCAAMRILPPVCNNGVVPKSFHTHCSSAVCPTARSPLVVQLALRLAGGQAHLALRQLARLGAVQLGARLAVLRKGRTQMHKARINKPPHGGTRAAVVTMKAVSCLTCSAQLVVPRAPERCKEVCE